MPLWWIVHKYKGKRRIFIQEGSYSAFARVKARLMGHDGVFVECHQLDAKIVRKLPKASIGQVLSSEEARKLLERLG